MESYLNEETMADQYRTDIQVCSGCLQQEGEEKFSVCKRCKSVFYCSKDCQIRHWSVHKRICTNKLHKKQSWTDRDKLQDFENRFHPLLANLTVISLMPPRRARNKSNRSVWLGATHFLKIQMKDTPRNSPVPIQIGEYSVCKISNQSVDIQNAVQSRIQSVGPTTHAVCVAVLEYGNCRNFPVLFMNFAIFSDDCDREKTPHCGTTLAEQARFRRKRAEDFKLQINAMASGKNQHAMTMVEHARTSKTS